MTWTPENVAKLAREGREKFAEPVTKEPQMSDQERDLDVIVKSVQRGDIRLALIQYGESIEAARAEERRAFRGLVNRAGAKAMQLGKNQAVDALANLLKDLETARSRNEQ